MKHKYLHTFAAIVAILFFAFIVWIIYLANTGGDSIFFDFVRTIPYGDKIGHVGLFGFLTLLSIIGLGFRSVAFNRLRIYYGCILVLIFVFVEEFSQIFISSRTFDLGDLAANLVGILIATAMCFWIKNKQD